MSTPQDRYNRVETATVNALKRNAWLNDQANVKTIHVKLKEHDGEMPTYQESELPAISIWCPGKARAAQTALGRQSIYLRVLVFVFAYSSTRDAADDVVKVITDRVEDLLAVQMAPDRFPDASRLDDFATDVMVDGNTDFDSVRLNVGWLSMGAFEIVVRTLRYN